MFENLKTNCALCNKANFKFLMLKKDNSFFCRNCLYLCDKFNGNNSINNFSLSDLKKLIVKKDSIIHIKKNEHIIKRKEEYKKSLNSITMLSPTIDTNTQYKRNFLKDMPEYKFSLVRKNTPIDRLQNFIAIDTETTGLHPSTNELVEISAVKFINGEPVECLTSLVKPKKEISQDISNINHITNKMVENSPKIENITASFNDFCKGFNIVGYNLKFDLKFLYVNNINLFNEKRYFFDALELAKKLYKNKLYNFKLDTVAEELELYRTNAHRATEDAFVTGIIFRDLGNYLIQ
ncbi:MAG: PolC-type DNA polymerase III [Clostridia bacterium]